MHTINIALKDLSQILRERMAVVFIVIMPLVFTFIMGFAYKGFVTAPDPRMTLGWVNQDENGLISQQLKQSLDESGSLKLSDVKPEKADEQVSSGKLPAVLIVPVNFSQDSLDGKPVQLILVVNDMSNTGQSALQLLRPVVTRLMSAVEIAQLDVKTLSAQKPFNNETEQQTELTAAFSQAAQVWKNTLTSGVSVIVEKATGQKKSQVPLGGNPYNQSSPGILLQFTIMGLVSSANILVQERKTRTLQRLITTAVKPSSIIAGHMLVSFVMVLFQQLVLIIFGQILLHVNYFRQPVGILLVAMTLGLWISSLGLFFGIYAKNEDQALILCLIAMFVFTALGGGWFPLEGSGKAFSFVARLTPGAWAMEGFQNILIRGLGLESALLPSAILLAYAVLFFILAVWRFRKDQQSG